MIRKTCINLAIVNFSTPYQRFGASIENMCKKNWCNDDGVPKIIINFKDYFLKNIDKEDILRKNGRHGGISDIIRTYNSSEIDLDLEAFARDRLYDVHTFNGAFKRLLREMDPPLIPFELAAHIRNSGFATFRQEKREAYARELIMLLKRSHRATLKLIIDLMVLAVQQNRDEGTQLDIAGIAVCIGPSLLYEKPFEPAQVSNANQNTGSRISALKLRMKSYNNIKEVHSIRGAALASMPNLSATNPNAEIPTEQTDHGKLGFVEFLILNPDIFNDIDY